MSEGVIPPLVLRADGDSKIGSGHVMRCVALAQAWQAQGGWTGLVGQYGTPYLEDHVKSFGLELFRIERRHPDKQDLAQTLGVLERMTAIHRIPPWLVLDGYEFDSDYQLAIQSAGYRLLVIDDINHLSRYHSDIILNQNMGAERLVYRCDPETKLLIGTRFALLRTEFDVWRKQRREYPEVARRVLVAMGGSDPRNLTLEVVRALNNVEIENLDVAFVIGPANPHFESVRAEAVLARYHVRLLRNVTSMSDIIAWADLSIVAAGSTCWELACTGLPAIVLQTEDHQQAVAEGLGDIGAAVNLGPYDHGTVDRVAAAVCRLSEDRAARQEMGAKAMEQVDPSGACRVVAALSIA